MLPCCSVVMYCDNLQQTSGCPLSSQLTLWHSDTRQCSPPPLPPPQTVQGDTTPTWWSLPQHMSTLPWQGQAQSPGTDLGWCWLELYCPPVDLTRQWMRPGTWDKPLAVYYCQFSIVLTNWGNTLICEDCFLITFTFSSTINTILCSETEVMVGPGGQRSAIISNTGDSAEQERISYLF